MNPSALTVHGTRKNRNKPTGTGEVLNPNTLRQKFVQKIKNHKNHEQKKASITSVPQAENDFEESLNYLSELSKRNTNTKTKTTASNNITYVQVSLPDSLQEHTTTSIPRSGNFGNFGNVGNLEKEVISGTSAVEQRQKTSLGGGIITLNDAPIDVPYGNLIGGTKPTFRQWTNASNKTRKLNVATPTATNSVAPCLPISLPTVPISLPTVPISLPTVPISLPTVPIAIAAAPVATTRISHTVGKSSVLRRVSILLKDNATRKIITDAKNNLKRKSINEVRNYLKDRGLLKNGSRAPNDIIRKTYESAILAGSVVNRSIDTHLYNFADTDEN